MAGKKHGELPALGRNLSQRAAPKGARTVGDKHPIEAE